MDALKASSCTKPPVPQPRRRGLRCLRGRHGTDGNTGASLAAATQMKMCKRQAHSSRGSRCPVYHLQGLSRSPAAPAALSRHFMDWGHTARSRLGGFHRGSSRCLMPRSISGCMRTKTRRASARCLPLVAFACALAPTACGPSSPIAYCHLRPRMHARMAICPSCRRRRCRCAYHVNNVSQRPLSFATAHVRRRGKGVSAGTFQHPCTPFPHAREWQASMPAWLRAIGLNRASLAVHNCISISHHYKFKY